VQRRNNDLDLDLRLWRGAAPGEHIRSHLAHVARYPFPLQPLAGTVLPAENHWGIEPIADGVPAFHWGEEFLKPSIVSRVIILFHPQSAKELQMPKTTELIDGPQVEEDPYSEGESAPSRLREIVPQHLRFLPIHQYQR
jgi:hypothetical protein